MKNRTRRIVYSCEAAATLAVARLAVTLVSAAKLIAWASRPPRRVNRFAAAVELPWISWSIDRVAAKPLFAAKCLPRALAAHHMLRRRGVLSRVCLGVRRNGETLEAHAWLELGQTIIVGAAEAPRFTRLIEIGADQWSRMSSS
jgi:hypothetical protein